MNWLLNKEIIIKKRREQHYWRQDKTRQFCLVRVGDVNKPLEHNSIQPTYRPNSCRVYANHTGGLTISLNQLTLHFLYIKQEMLNDIFVTILPLLVTRSLAPRNNRKRRELDSMQC